MVESDDLHVSDEEEEKKYNWVKSSSKYKIEDIVGVVVGGVSSRFWMLRKHLNSIKTEMYDNEDNIPFYAWQCITIQFKHRDLDLIIRKDKNIRILMKFLMYSINSVDG